MIPLEALCDAGLVMVPHGTTDERYSNILRGDFAERLPLPSPELLALDDVSDLEPERLAIHDGVVEELREDWEGLLETALQEIHNTAPDDEDEQGEVDHKEDMHI